MSIGCTRKRCILLSVLASVVANCAFSRPLPWQEIPVSYNCSGQMLSNTVVYENTSYSFPRIDDRQPAQWQVIPSSETFNPLKTISDYNGNVAPQFTNTYNVTPSELMIYYATVDRQGSPPYSTAGLYILNYAAPNCTTAANLIVIKSGPICQCDASDPNNVKLNCSVDFTEATSQPNRPILTWVDDSNSVVKQTQPIPAQISPFLKRSKLDITISRSDESTYTCRLTFGEAPSSPKNYVTTTAPTFSASCSIEATSSMSTVITQQPTTTTTTRSPTFGNQPPASQQSKDVIIGVVVGVGGAVILALLISFICYRIRMNKAAGTKEERSTENERELGQHPVMREKKKTEQEGNENIGAYEMLTDRSTQLPPVYCQLGPLEHENSAANNFPDYYNLDQ